MKGYVTVPTSPLLPNQSANIYWRSAEDNKIGVELLDDDFSNPIDGSGFQIKIPFKLKPDQASDYITSLFSREVKFFQQSTIKACIVNLAYYVPSHDIIMSIMMQLRFDKSGSVSTRSFEVLPTQIFIAGSSNNDQVKSLESMVYFLANLRFICSIYTFLLGCMKIYYR